MGARYRILPILYCLLIAWSAGALEVSSANFRNLWNVLMDTHVDAAPTPILQSPGVSIELKFLPWLSVSPSLDIYYTNYFWSESEGMALPAESENASGGNATVVGLIVDLPVLFTFQVVPTFSISLGGGLAALIRGGFLSSGMPESGWGYVNKINAYFWENGRFFYPEACLGFAYRLSESLLVGFNGRVLFPLFHLWANDGLPFLDQMVVSFGLVVSLLDPFKLAAAPPQAAAQADQAEKNAEEAPKQ